EDEYTHTVDVPIELTNVRSDRIITNNYPTIARVAFQGSGKQMLRLLLENGVKINLNVKDKRYNFKTKLKLTDIRIPQHSLGIKALRIENPDTIEIRLAKIKKKRIKIEPDVVIIPEAGYTKVGEIELTPDSITISGPVKEVDLINSITTEHLEVKNIKRDYHQEIKLAIPSNQFITLQNKEVNIKIHIQKLMEKEISRVPVQVYNLPEGMRAVVIPPYLNLTLEGGVQVLAGVTENNVTAYIDYSRKKKENEIGHLAIIRTPPEVMYRDVSPKTFKLLLEKD
ncbi:hypothetical protein JW964_02010, partial [candidate division KSB1 bacterium]|nr:hypothetical protein [candidate division KSB1 bacterium]